MSMLATLISAGGAAPKLYVDDVFSAYTYLGANGTQSINNGIDLAGKGGMVWLKSRLDTSTSYITDTAIGVVNNLVSSTSGAATTGSYISSYSSTGFVASGGAMRVNNLGSSYASWTFRTAPKFFLNTTVTKSTGSNATVDLSNLGTVGMVVVKRTDSTGSWYVWHRSATAGKLLYLEQAAAEATLGHITVSGTTLTLVNGVIADGSYVVYAWAHDSSVDGIVQCGSFTTDASGNATVTLGWEPQFILGKPASSALGWYLFDTSRGMPVNSPVAVLQPNTSGAELTGTLEVSPNAVGFTGKNMSPSQTWIYLAIRRSNKPPTTGTQVYNAIARAGTGAAATVTGVGFAVDLAITKKRSTTTITGARFTDRLRGKTLHLDSTATTAEVTTADTVTGFDVMDGFVLGADATTSAFNTSTHTYVNHFFKRAPGVFDVVCYNGTGVAKTEAHSLGVVPEFMVVRPRNAAENWWVYHNAALTNIRLDTTAAPSGLMVVDLPTTTSFRVGASTNTPTNSLGNTHVAYLFASKAGISKVGSYTGNGTSQTINCGFAAGARFVLIKRTDAAGDWYVWDTVRGIVAGNDPHLSLNTTAAEVTSDDSIDPDVSGFIVNQLAATNINVNAASYIFLAFA